MNLKLLAAAASLSFAAGSAQAWDVLVSQPDVFGNRNLTATSYGANNLILRIECGSGRDPFVAVLIRSDSETSWVALDFLVASDTSTPVEGAAVLDNWNERYIAAMVDGEEDILAVVGAMETAQRFISVGVRNPRSGYQIADTFSARGSTAAAQQVREACFP